jgi:hypothetical protein
VGNPTVVVDFVANTRQLQKGIRNAGSQTSGFGSKLKGLAKTGALAAGAAGVGALVYTLKTGISEFQDSQKIAAQTAATLKSTGGAAHVSSKQVAELANALMKKSGIDDEAIQSGENLLLTFTKVQNQVGKGNDVFNQATKTMTDMSVALGQDMKSSALQLGKALNDPVKGVTALQRVGVSFTAQQKEQIKALEDSGQHLKAQKLILAELNKEFGGSAEAAGKTLPGQLSILRESFNNFAGDLVAKLAPALQASIGWLRDHWPEISAVIGQAWASIKPVLTALGDLVVSVFELIRDHWGQIGPIVDQVADSIKTAFKVIGDILRVVADLLRGDWSQAWDDLKTTIVDAADLIVQRIKLTLLPLELTLTALWNGIKAAADVAWDGLQKAVTTVTGGIKTAFDGVVTFLTALGARIQTALADVKTWLSKPGAWVEDAVSAAKTALNGLLTFITNLPGRLSTAFSDVKTWLSKPGQWVEDAVSAAKGAFDDLVEFIKGLPKKLLKPISDVADAIKGPINAVLGAWNSIQFSVPPVHIKMPGPIPDINFGGASFGVPHIPLLAKGGVVSQPTLAMVGEGQGREIVAPESLLRQIMGEQRLEVRVFIGDTELRGLVRAEIVRQDNRTAQTLLAGLT